VATKPKSKPKYDLKAADRKRNLFIQVGLTAVVVVFAVALVFYIVSSGHEKPASGEAKSVRVTSGQLITKEGSTEPKAVLGLYEDFLCPHCGEFEKNFGPTVKNLIDSGAVAADYYMVGILDRPQNDDYPSRAGSAAYCVADQGIDQFRRFHAALYAQQPNEQATSYPDNKQLAETARQAGAGGDVAQCIDNNRYQQMVQGLAQATGITATPTIKLNGQDISPKTPEDLVTQVKAIVGDVPGLQAAPPHPDPAPAPAS
jgi:protein-disulfide isomerase